MPPKNKKRWKYTPTDKVRKHIALWEDTDFADQNRLFGGDAIRAKAQEFSDMLGDKGRYFTQEELDGMFSTFYNLAPRTFDKRFMPHIDAYVDDTSPENLLALKDSMTSRYEISAPKYQKGIKRRAAADVELMGNSFPSGTIKTDANKSVVFGPTDWSKYEQPAFPAQPLVRTKEVNTQYPINSNVPNSISSWIGADSPAYGGYNPRVKSVQEVNREVSALNQQLIWDVFDKAANAYGSKSFLPTTQELMHEGAKDYVKGILGNTSAYDFLNPTLSPFRIPDKFYSKGKDVTRKSLPRFDEGTPTTVGPYNVYPSALRPTNTDIPYVVTTPEINVYGQDKRPLYQRYDAYGSTYDPNAIRSITDWVPGIGDVSQGFDAVNAFKNQDYMQAGMLGALMFAPNALEPVVKPLLRGASKFTSSVANLIKGGTSSSTYGDGALSALSRRWEPEELKMLSKRNPIRKSYGKNHDQYPEEVKNSIYNSVYNRMSAQRADADFAKDFSNAFTEKYTTYSAKPFDKVYGEDSYAGLYFKDTDHKAIRDGYTDYALGHETVHELDSKLGRTPREHAYLEDAFDEDFLKNATADERSTTNYDSRKTFLGNAIDSKTPIEKLNEIIDAATDDEVFDAVERSNNYGRKYIEEKRSANKLDHLLAERIKESWKKVGAAAIPMVPAGTALYTQAKDFKKEDWDNAINNLKVLAEGVGYNSGKDISIKPSKRGTFTAAAKKHNKSVLAFASQVLSNPGKYSKAMRKKAQFAKNASKWSH